MSNKDDDHSRTIRGNTDGLEPLSRRRLVAFASLGLGAGVLGACEGLTSAQALGRGTSAGPTEAGSSTASDIFDSVASLKASDAHNGQPIVFVLGYRTPGDGGGGIFFWDPQSSRAEDYGTVFVPTGYTGSGRWKRLATGTTVLG